jgi:hypothetical protein
LCKLPASTDEQTLNRCSLWFIVYTTHCMTTATTADYLFRLFSLSGANVGGACDMVHPDALDRQSFLLMVLWIANKAYGGKSSSGETAANSLVTLIREHVLPHSKLFSPTDIKTIMLEEENAQVLLEHVKILKLLFIRYKQGEVVGRKRFLDFCKEVDLYRYQITYDDIVRIFKMSG